MSAPFYTQGGGTAPTNSIPIIPIVADYSPSSIDTRGPSGPFPVGQKWVNSLANQTYTLTSYSVSNGLVSAVWTAEGSQAGGINTIDANSGSATPSSGTISIVGSGVVSTSATGDTVTISVSGSTSLVSSIGTSGSGTATPVGGEVNVIGLSTQVVTNGSGNTVTVSLADEVSIEELNITSALNLNNAPLTFNGAGSYLQFFPGANCIGQVQLDAGAAVVETPLANTTANVYYFFSYATVLAGPGFLGVGTVVPGTSFQILSSDGSDVGFVNWMIIGGTGT